MSLTISELEAERAKILEEIENKAQKFSGDSNKTENPSLKSWLNAAEEVMPASKPDPKMRTKPKTQSKSNYQSQVFKPPRNRAPFFGGLIVLTLILTLLGVIYIAYSSIHKELQNVLIAHEKSVVQMQTIQADMVELQKTIATGGKVDLFIALEDKLFALESQVLALKAEASPKTLEHPLEKLVVNEEVTSSLSESTRATPNASDDNLVTVSVLNQSLKRYTEQLDARIDQKLETILNYLSKQGGDKNLESTSLNGALVEEPITPTVMTPTVSEVKKPVIDRPLVNLVQAVKTPTAPDKVTPPLKHYSADVKWLSQEPSQHYILQLASMPEAHSLKEIADKKQLQNVRIVPQIRKGVTNYVLITGSFADRKEAREFAQKIKSESGISPWIRKVKDLSSRL
ncbi:MAG: SPOR domain-containing protein [Thiomicrorhabdus sp.]|nr:SPOR domain-containing protein [Thiomicrorhabdus sp.]